MAWYRSGTVAVTNSGTGVTGTGTAFVANVKPGDMFFGPNGLGVEIASVNSDTQLTLATAYAGSTASAQSYGISPTTDYARAQANSLATLISTYSTIASNAGAGKFGDGTSAAPGISFGSNPNTGFYRAAANTIGVALNGAEVGRFDSNGLVLGFTSNFTADTATSVIPRLAVSGTTGSSSAIGAARYSADTANASLYFAKARGTQAAPSIVQSGDNVGGIGFTGHDGSVGFRQLAAITAAVDGTPGAGDMPGRLAFSTTADGAATWTERMRIDSSGNIGVGVTAPRGKLDIGGSLAYNADFASGVVIGPTVENSVDNGKAYAWRMFVTGNASSGQRLAVSSISRLDSTFTERVSVTGSGNVGIGTGSPSSRIHVVDTSGGVLADFAGPTSLFQIRNDRAEVVDLKAGTNDAVAVSTNGAERLRIDASGYVGVGTTTPASYTTPFSSTAPRLVVAVASKAIATLRGNAAGGTDPTACGVLALQRSGSAVIDSLSATTAGDTLGVIEASGVNSTPALAAAARISFTQEGIASGNPTGLIKLQTANGASPVDRMLITAAGAVLVGQSAATGDALLQVSNGVRFGVTTSSDANTLDYYQEGTFTPTIAGTTTAGTGTYSTQNGRYTRTGNRVHFDIDLTWTAHDGTGNIDVAGLPFTSSSSSLGNVTVVAQNLTFAGQIAGVVTTSSTRIGLRVATTGAALASVAMDTAATLRISGTYEV